MQRVVLAVLLAVFADSYRRCRHADTHPHRTHVDWAEPDLPLEDVEGVFCNHKVYGLDHVLRPGDRVAFVPRGTPGPQRFTLGLYSAGRGAVKP